VEPRDDPFKNLVKGRISGIETAID